MLQKFMCLENIQKWKSVLSEKNRWVKLLLLADAVLLAFFLIFYFHRVNNLIHYHFDSDQIASYTNDEYAACFGGTIDENYESGLYDAIPDFFLRKGYYRYTLNYESTSADSFSWPHTYVETFDVIEQAVTYFTEGTGTHTDEFWLNADLSLALRVFYSGTGSAAITDFEIWETSSGANIKLFYRVLALLVINLLFATYVYAKHHTIANSGKYVFAGMIALCIFCSHPLFLDYVVKCHDIDFHLTRIEGVKDGLLSGQFPVRISPTFYGGYGYATSIFYGELLLYFPAFLRLVGFPLTTCYNVYAIFVNLITCFGGYYCFRRMFKSSAVGMAVTVLYAMAPYRLMDMYLRAAVGEYTAMAFLPFILYGLYRVYTEDVKKKEYKWCFVPLVVGMTGVIHTHVLTGEIMGVVIMIVCVLLFFRTLQKNRFWALVKSVLVTVAINLWFLIPFVDFALTQEIRVFKASSDELIQKTGTYFTQLISLFQEYGWRNDMATSSGIAGEMPLTLGMPLALGLILCVTMLFIENKEKRKEKRCGAFVVLLTILVGWMSTIYFPWDRISTAIPLLRKMVAAIQFLWRFLAPLSALAAVATGFGLLLLSSKEGKKAGALASVTLGILAVIPAMQWMGAVSDQAPIRLNNTSSFNTTHTAIGGEYVLTEARYEVVTAIFEPRVFDGVIENYEKTGTNISFSVKEANESCYVLLPLLNYKGYYVTSADGVISNENLSTGEAAVIRIDIPAGYSGDIAVRYRGFWYWRIAEIVSLVSVALLITLYCKDNIRRKG